MLWAEVLGKRTGIGHGEKWTTLSLNPNLGLQTGILEDALGKGIPACYAL